MRIALPFLALTLSAAPAAAPAQTLVPLPAVEPTEAAAPARTVAPPPAPVQEPVAPQAPEQPTQTPPVIVPKESSGVGDKLGVAAGGIALGAAGAAVAGPVGKFAGGFIGKKLAQSLFGKDDGIPEVRTLSRAPAATEAGADALAAPATAPPLKARVADRASPRS